MPYRRPLIAWCIAGVFAGCIHLHAGWLQRTVGADAASTSAVHPAALSQAPPAASTPPRITSLDRTLIDKYCVTCHNKRLKTAGLALDAVDVTDAAANAEIWENVVRKLRTGAMPPARMPQPDVHMRDAFASQLEVVLDDAARSRPNPGRMPVHRLNRSEYANAIRDLLALEIDSRSLLSADDADHGFDNMAGVLSISPVLLEEYVAAARRISRLAVGDPTIGPALEAKTYALPTMLFQEGRMGDDLPFGSRGGLAVHHYFPLDGEYMLSVRLQRTNYGYIRGLAERHDLEVRLEGERITSFSVGGEDKGRPAPVSYSGNYLPGDPAWEEYMISGADAALNVRFLAKAGRHPLTVSFAKKASLELEGVLQPPLTGFGYQINESRTSPEGFSGPAVESVTINGPYNASGPGETASRRRIFVCYPRKAAEERSCATSILTALARRAFRRPVTREDIQALLEFYDKARHTGDFEAGVRTALQRLLADPEFLFRIEGDPASLASGTPYRVSDVALASRLSFFLWSSIPDDELLTLAANGQLRNSATLEQQVGRMLADKRSQALVENFVGQWLSLRQLRNVAPDPDLFPEFDENLREALRRETEMFVESQIREDRGVLNLLTADYTFLNDRLARHYGIPNVYGSHFRRVPLRGMRGGLVGHASILTVTSYPNRTSPVLRGHWLLENLIGAPPPPPPPDVPALEDNRADQRPRSMRERMELHRKNPVCATCHVRMDPLGFALEGFDVIGRTRAADESGAPVDAAGTLPDGTHVEGLPGLRTLLLKHPEEFIGTVTEKLLTYALGRSIQYYDRPAVRQILRETASEDHRWSALIIAVVKSIPFQMKRSES